MTKYELCVGDRITVIWNGGTAYTTIVEDDSNRGCCVNIDDDDVIPFSTWNWDGGNLSPGDDFWQHVILVERLVNITDFFDSDPKYVVVYRIG